MTVTGINRVLNGPDQVFSYLDGIMEFDSDLFSYVRSTRLFFEYLRPSNLNLSPSKATVGTMDGDFLGDTTFLLRIGLTLKISWP